MIIIVHYYSFIYVIIILINTDIIIDEWLLTLMGTVNPLIELFYACLDSELNWIVITSTFFSCLPIGCIENLENAVVEELLIMIQCSVACRLRHITHRQPLCPVEIAFLPFLLPRIEFSKYTIQMIYRKGLQLNQ